MKFVTEIDLRGQYKQQAFCSYTLEPGVRLTPEARQFLLDRGIPIHAEQHPGGVAGNPSPIPSQQPDLQQCSKRQASRLQRTYTEFLLSGQQLLAVDVVLAQEVMALAVQLQQILSPAHGEEQVAPLVCRPCTGITPENFSEDLGDCFPITPFHIQLENGRQIALLCCLRSAVQQLSTDLCELGEQEPGAAVGSRLNEIANTLNALICRAVGGKTCQRV